MKFIVLTLFPEMFAPVRESILKRGQNSGAIDINLVNFRDYALSKHKNVDDIPYGGGVGMVLKPEPIFTALRDLPPTEGNRKIILLSPQGRVFNQQIAVDYSCVDELTLICGHYEGFDERIRNLADDEISIGDYVLTGGELAAMVVIDAVARHVPGVLGRDSSADDDSHSQGLLEYPQYTRPYEFEGMRVPEVLISGHHLKIDMWRRKEAIKKTFLRRPDLFSVLEFTSADYILLEELAIDYPEINKFRVKWEHLKPLQKRRKNNKSSNKASDV
ncbi:MAG: tRNA (guanosine(37)-N1)-methyltransferase TrmD [Eubacteriales bacterium]